MDFPVSRIAESQTFRLVASARLRDPVLRKLVDDEFLGDLAEIEGATSGRLTAFAHGADAIDAREFVAGVPHAAFVNAAFAYWRPQEINRFNGPGRGAWYGALTAPTALAEVTFHMTRELERVRDFQAVVDYAQVFASFAGDFVDLRKIAPIPECLDPDPTRGYPAGNVVATATREAGHNGIVYPSFRHPEGTCLVALRPQAVQSVAQGEIIRLSWNGGPEPEIEMP